MVFTLPNYFTILRIILIPLYIFFFLKDELLLSGIIFIISAITDFLDGFIARKYNLVSQLGKILDPLADKLTIISILILLIIKNIVPQCIAWILLFRELFIFISSVIVYISGLNVINPTKIGKISIFLLYVAIAAKLLEIPYLETILFFIVIPMNVYSGFDYIYKFYKKLL